MRHLSLRQRFWAGYELFRLWRITRGGRNSRYLRWRHETAFGIEESRWPTARERRRAMLSYGAWVHDMRRLARQSSSR